MRVNQTASVNHPIAITSEFLDRIAGIFEELKGATYEALARKNSLDISDVKRIETMSEDDFREPDWPRESSKEQFDEHIRQVRQKGTERQIAEELRGATETTYTVTYDSGLKTGTDDIEQFKSLLREESGKVDYIHVSYGGYGGTRVMLRLGGEIRTANFDISGERKEVDYIFRSISELLRSSAPDHPFLHTRWVQGSVAIVISALFANAGLDFFGLRLVEETSEARTAVAEILLRLLLGLPLLLYILHVAEKAFPKCQVEFGPAWRHQNALRARLYFILTIVLIPVLINVFF